MIGIDVDKKHFYIIFKNVVVKIAVAQSCNNLGSKILSSTLHTVQQIQYTLLLYEEGYN